MPSAADADVAESHAAQFGAVEKIFGVHNHLLLEQAPDALKVKVAKLRPSRTHHQGMSALIADLKDRGVAFENYDMPGEKSPSGVITAGGAKAAWFKDSEGNILAIIQNA